MAGFFQNLRLVSERSTFDDLGTPDSNAYATTNVTATGVDVTTTVTAPTLNIQNTVPGFGSYLDGILPSDIATACGAFSASMQQIKNISSIPIEKFAQVVTSIETTKGLNVNGTNVPTDTTLAQQGLALIALGTGPYGTYTMSNFLGCMSGLPYLGLNIRQYIQELETPKLYDIYEQLYLATTWQGATVTVQSSSYVVESPPTVFTTYYHVTGVSIATNGNGGGYGRAGAPAPIITISGGSGATATCTIGTDPNNAGTNGAGTFGRLLQVTLTSSGTDVTTPPTISIETPPTASYAYPYTGGTNTVGGSFSNTALQDLIDDANEEISAIKDSQPAKSQRLISNWETSGTLLSIEQRAISNGLPIRVPNSSPDDEREPTLATYPTTQYSFVDSVPQYALNTDPHMYSQTIEAISDYATMGGRSLVAMLRQARNQDRLTKAGIPLDNNISDTLTNSQQSQLVGNGVLANSVPAGILGNTVSNTVVATLSTVLGNTDPYGYYDPTDNTYYITNSTYYGSDNTVNTGQVNVGVGNAFDTGQADEPGSFAGSKYQDLINPELSPIYTSSVLLPSTYSITEAIDEVIRCNCDCWDNV